MSLTTSKSILYPDILSIVEPYVPIFNSSFTFTAKLHTEEKDLSSDDGVLFIDAQIIRDYVNNMSDYIEVKLQIPLGTFIYDVYPYLSNLEFTLTTIKQMFKPDKLPFIQTERYKAVYLFNKNVSIPTEVTQSKGDLNQNLPISVTLQIVDRSAETIRVKTVQGNFDPRLNPKNTDMSPKSFLKSLFTNETNLILIDNKPPLDYITIEDPDNTEQLKNFNLPSKTRVVEVPEYIQHESIGMYRSGIGCYIQRFGMHHYKYRKCLYIYSLYSSKKYDKAEYKILFYIPEESGHSIGDITYKYVDKVLRVVPHATKEIFDRKETNFMSSGSGFRVANASSMMKKPVLMSDNGPVFTRQGLNTEVTFKDRKDKINFAPNLGTLSNLFEVNSKMAEQKGRYITLQVNNLDPDFIYPGAACKISYEDKQKKVKDVYGVIHKANITFSSPNLNLAQLHSKKEVVLTCSMLLQIFIDKDGDDE